ncbi:MAG: DUF1761 domain-containing protein [Hyphomicrobiales bacterium]|nr:DUF1761 domain-containing protein [Hyphomicrobiales bacterium]
MAFAGINYLAVVVAAVIAWIAGAGWYMALGKPWTAALGLTSEQMAQARKRPGGNLPFLYSLIAELLMAWVLAGVIAHLGKPTPRLGVISAAFCWAGFVITTLVTNYSFGMRGWRLIAIDGGHWLLVLLIMGAVLGAMGI